MSSTIAVDRLGFIVGHLLSVKEPCRVGTTAAITLSGNQTIDGVAVVDGDRVLVKDQSDTRENSIYVVSSSDWELASDFDQRDQVVRGTRVLITDGTTQGMTEWTVTTTGRPLPGRSSIEFSSLTNILDTGFISSLTTTYGAVGDGTTDDTVAITAADATVGFAKFAPDGIYDTTIAATALDGPYWGFGQIRDAANNLRAPFFTAIKTNAAYTASNEDSPDTAFNGDFSLVPFPVEHRITGAATLTQPATGYVYAPWATPHYTYLYNESGHNEGTADNTGRTAATAHRVKISHVGGGDAVAYNASILVNATRSGSTDFLANPAGALFNGDLVAGQAGVYLNAGEISLDDNGVDAAGIGWVINLDRSVATGAKGAFWSGFRAQSIGSADVNSAFCAVGGFDVGLDFSHITTDVSKAAIALKADDRVYGNTSSSNGRYATTLEDEYFTYSSSLTAWNFVVGGASALQIYASEVVAPVALRATVAANAARFVNTSDSASVQVARLEGDRATMVDNDEAYLSLMLSNDGGTQTEFARQTWVAVDVNAGTSVDGRIDWAVVTAGTLADELSLDGAALYPSSSGGLNLGITNTNPFANLFLGTAGKIDWANGGITLTETSDALAFAGGTLYTFDSGRIIKGHTASLAYDNAASEAHVQVHGTDAITSSVSMARWSNGATAPALQINKSRGTSIGSHTIVATEDIVALFRGSGSDGTNFVPTGDIRVSCDATPGSSSVPGRVSLFTSTGATATTERLRCDSKGNNVLAFNTAALSTVATDGLVYIPTSTSGSTTAPVGTPTSYTGMTPMVYNTALNRLYVYNGAWRSVVLSS